MQNRKFCEVLLLSVVLAGILSLPSVISSLMNSTIIKSSGQISIPNNTAKSGYWRDIQEAVDWVVAHGGGNVYIPEGTYNFSNPGESWTHVDIPGGVTIFGAPTERYSNGSVVEWKTVLVMPYEAPYAAWFFHVSDQQDPNKSVRISDIKFVGYREIDNSSTLMHGAIWMCDILNFRVDHCYFRNLCKCGVRAEVDVYGQYGKKEYGRTYTCGVIDHCIFQNTHGEPRWSTHTVEYGVYCTNRGSYNEDWESDTSKVLGQYTNYSIYIEDCYFEKWRHCVAANFGAHYVFRHNIIKDDFGMSLDAHGWGHIQDGRILVGTRAIEVYENQFLNPIGGGENDLEMPLVRGGSGVFFNNTVEGYKTWVLLTQEADDEVSKCQVHDVYVWNNTLSAGTTDISVSYGSKNPIIEGVHYFRYAPHTFNYTPYTYPHPLTLEK